MASIDEGYVKFQSIWSQTMGLPASKLTELNQWRDEMHRHHLIGVYDNDIGFGNISQRFSDNQFIITGTATGHLRSLSPAHYVVVTDFDIEKNTVHCRGPILASSEAMSHAVIYQACPEVQGVIHVHHAHLWEKLLDQVPTTERTATYGSPEIANAIITLLKDTDLRQRKIFVMRGHPEGVFSFGLSLGEAAAVIFHWLATV